MVATRLVNVRCAICGELPVWAVKDREGDYLLCPVCGHHALDDRVREENAYALALKTPSLIAKR